MKSNEIRRRFLDYFAREGHTLVRSGPLVPEGDPTLFFTNAGMVQFKDVFTGQQTRPYTRATSAQKCLRVSGKHNDLENVGRTPRHHTFFEMLGNFSFGDYFKADAIRYGWELLTKELGIDPSRLWITIYEDDDEAYEIWRKIDGVNPDRIQRLGEKENFWSMGDTGPCGPCSEIHYDHGAEYGPGGGPANGGDRFVEIWNLVFMQYDRAADGTMTPLPRPSIDTGAGLERLAAVLQGVYSNYDTDCFTPIISQIAERAGVRYHSDAETDVALQVIADHARATAQLVADGVVPSNEGRGYVLRRLMRRAIRYGVKLGLKDAFLHQTTDAVVDHLGEVYPELRERREFIREVVRGEEDRFSETLGKGLTLLDQELDALSAQGSDTLTGGVAFKLHDTYGFPLDLTRLIVEERGYKVDEQGYADAMETQRAAGRAAWRGSGEQAVADTWHRLAEQGLTTEFIGYDTEQGTAHVTALLKDGLPVDALGAGDSGLVVTDRSPLYAESGGQVADHGQLVADGLRAEVVDTQKPLGTFFVHSVQVESGTLQLGDLIELQVDHVRRERTRRNHTATHLLHAALRQVLGDHVTQKGSMVGPERLRFDFVHHKAMTPAQVEQVEDIVYGRILDNIRVDTEVTGIDEARARGAMALFGEKYGERVRVVDVPGFSTELCGGIHARRTGDIGLVRVTSEGGVAAGVRRIEALTGAGAFEWLREQDHASRAAANTLRTPLPQLPEAIARIVEDRKRLEKELERLHREMARGQAGDLLAQARQIGDISVLAAELPGDPKALREEAERLRDKLGSAVVVLGSREGGAVKLVATVSKNIAGKRYHAGNLIREVARAVGGGGGGRPDMAQAGGKNPDALPEALEKVYALLEG